MKQLHFIASLFTLLVLSSACSKVESTNSEEKIVRGRVVAQTSPAYLSAVRLDLGGGLCTGTVIGPRLILTAAHCLANVPAEQIQVYFEHATSPLAKDKVRRAVRTEAFKPFGAALFPNFDIGYVVLESDIPTPYAPMEILRDATRLGSETSILLAGYGNQSDNCSSGNCVGLLREANTEFMNYYDKAHIMSLMVFHGDKNKGFGGACNGDSGGPAYALVANKWYLIGVTNGMRGDITPQTDGTCDTGWDIYTHAGAYISWIEKGNALSLKKDLASNPDPQVLPQVVAGPLNKSKPGSWAEWVAYANHNDPAYYTVDTVLQYLIAASGSLKPESTSFLYDPAMTENLAATLPSLYLQGSLIGDLSPLKHLSSLKDLILDRTSVKDLSGLSQGSSLRYLGIRELDPDAPLTILNTLGEARKSLETLDLDFVPASFQNAIDWSAYSKLKVVSLVRATGTLDLSKIKPRLQANDSVLQIAFSTVEGQLKLDGFQNSRIGLDNLRSSDGSFEGKVDWPSLRSVNGLSLDGFGSKDFPDFSTLPALRELSVRGNELSSLSTLKLPGQLQTLDVSSNMLGAIDTKVPGLALIKAFDNPIVDANCPALSCQTDLFVSPATLEQFCANAVAAKQLEFQESYYATLIGIQQNLTGAAASELDCGIVQQYAGRLNYLDLRAQGLTDIRPLAFLPRVQYLALDSNSIKDIAPLLGMTGLDTLLIANNSLFKVPSLAKMTKLKTLHLMGNPIESLNVDAPSLEALYIGFNSPQARRLPFSLTIDPKTRLDSLYLGGIDLDADSLASIHNQQTLRTLYFTDGSSVNNEDWSDSLNLNLIATSQSNFEVCGLVNGTCVENKAGSDPTTVLGPLLGTTSGSRTETANAVVYLPGVASAVQTNSANGSF